MLKLVQQPNMQPRQSFHQGWALIRTSQKDPWHPIEVPFTVGSHADNDVFVNAPTMRALSKVVVIHDGHLTSVDAGTHDVVEIADLKKFGIECVGPFQEHPSQISRLKHSILRVLHNESMLYQVRYPAILKKFLPKEQRRRVVALACSAVLTLGAALTVLTAEPDVLDYSQRPIPLTVGHITRVDIGSAKPTDPYSKGSLFKIQGLKDVELSQTYVLSVGLTGLDREDEIQLNLNGHMVFQSPAKQSCLDNVCNFDIPINTQLLIGDASQQTLELKHHAIDSSYGVRSVFLRKMEAASDEERELARQLMASADRYFDERQLLVKNIKNAKDAIEELDRILGTRTGLDDIKPHFIISKSKIDQSFNETSRDLQFKLQKAMKLNQYRPAMQVIDDMLKLYPDPASKQNMMLTAQMKKLEGLVK